MRLYVIATLHFPCNAVCAPEHLTVNQGVTGSSPVGGVKACIRSNAGFFRPFIVGATFVI